MRTLCHLAFAAVSLVLATAYAPAQECPSRPVRIVVPTSPGTGTDVTARFLADKLPQELKGSLVIDNRRRKALEESADRADDRGERPAWL